MIGTKSTVYHSALVAETKDGPVKITITCNGPEPSKFDKNVDQIAFKHEGATQFYRVENYECGEALSHLKGQTVYVTAYGREEEATIQVEDVPENERRDERRPQQQRREPPPRREERQERPAERPPARQERTKPAPPTKEEKEAAERKAFTKMKILGARVAVAMKASFKFARQLAAEELGDNATTEDVRAIAMTHFIEVKSSTDMDALPHVWLEKTSQPAAEGPPARQERRPPPPPPDPEPEPEPEEPEDDDIPF